LTNSKENARIKIKQIKKGLQMRRIPMSGSAFRKALFMDELLDGKECGQYTQINGRIVSELLRGRVTFDRKNEKERLLIHDYYSKCRRPVSFEDFWCIEKIFEEVK
jgi:hypothetical protein